VRFRILCGANGEGGPRDAKMWRLGEKGMHGGVMFRHQMQQVKEHAGIVVSIFFKSMRITHATNEHKVTATQRW
jgi:hypothetical protein